MDAVRATNSPRVTAAAVAAAGGLSLSDAKAGGRLVGRGAGRGDGAGSVEDGRLGRFFVENDGNLLEDWRLGGIFRMSFVEVELI